MYNENEKRNIAVSQKGNAIQPAALNIHQLFPFRTKDECLLELKKNPSVYRTYLNWPDKWKNRFLEFMKGKKSLPLTYDPFQETVQPGCIPGTVITTDQQYHRHKSNRKMYPVK